MRQVHTYSLSKAITQSLFSRLKPKTVRSQTQHATEQAFVLSADSYHRYMYNCVLLRSPSCNSNHRHNFVLRWLPSCDYNHKHNFVLRRCPSTDSNHRYNFVLRWYPVILTIGLALYCVYACLPGWSSPWITVFLPTCVPVCLDGRHFVCLFSCLHFCLPARMVAPCVPACLSTYLSAWLSNGRHLGCLDGPHLGCLGGGHLGCLPSCLVARLPVSLAGRPHQCLYPRTPQVDFHCRNDMPRSAVCITPGTTTGRGETAERLVYALI